MTVFDRTLGIWPGTFENYKRLFRLHLSDWLPRSLATITKDMVAQPGDLCRACSIHAERIMELVEEGVLEPVGRTPTGWLFSGVSLRRARAAVRLQRDLGVNLPGVSPVLELLDEIETLTREVERK